MKVLVTGASGFVGQNMVAYLSKETDWKIETWEWSSNSQDWPKVVQYDWVIHLGAEIHNVAEMDLKNVVFSKWLFNECQAHGVHMQYASSSSVYGHGKTGFTEYSECDPLTMYARTKLEFDEWAFAQSGHNSYVQGFRYFNVYGKWMHLRGNRANLLHKWRQEARNTGKIQVWEGSEYIRRDWTWAGDVCSLHLDFINQVKGSGIWNVGTGVSHSLMSIAEEIADYEMADVVLIPRPQDIAATTIVADLTHLKETIGKRKWLNVYEWLALE